MKKTFFILFTFVSVFVFGQIPAYYNNVNLTLTGQALKNELANKITVTHTNWITYSDVWTALEQTDLDPTNTNNVLLLYGYNDGDGNPITDRTRDKTNQGGNNGQWNREHTYAQSLANPSMSTSTPGPGTDAHHIRSSDVQMNGNRGNRLFAAGSGNAGNAGANWYPGDEWKGDVARMMMYMYLRYGSQCLPTGVGVGTTVPTDANMISLFLQWNAEDTVSQYEKNRNNLLQGIQGNRNPFIDNPYLATIIWNGTPAQDNWNMTTSITENDFSNFFDVYPNPTTEKVFVKFGEEVSREPKNQLEVYTISGKLVSQYFNNDIKNNTLEISLPKGFYVLKFETTNTLITKKVVVR
ncbi:MAG: endonuclease [Flavobacteriales bacterium]|nr:endonuclease [Flavobacteriales bacterium]MCB9175191.1 endonuclease [Flavobacteriales bacterium]